MFLLTSEIPLAQLEFLVICHAVDVHSRKIPRDFNKNLKFLKTSQLKT